MEIEPDAPSPFNPLAGNPLRTRGDIAEALRACYEPLRACQSADGSRALIDGTGTLYDGGAADLESFARPLWGLAAAAVGGVDEAGWWASLSAGIGAGTDPGHCSYWGAIGNFDQRIVELPALAFAAAVAPSRLVAPEHRGRVAAYLRQARGRRVFDNNWQLFPALIEIGLGALGEVRDDEAIGQALRTPERFHAGDGWYRDGDLPQIDHYSGFAFHFYQLLILALLPEAVDRKLIEQRARTFAAGFTRWFADDGAALPFGRSLTYRFAHAAFFGACAFAGVEALPWGAMKGYYLRNLRWWRQWPITRRDGVLSVGYGYPNSLMAEEYNGPASPYWAFKAFLPLALDADHPFWRAEEEHLPPPIATTVIAAAGMIARAEPGQVAVLSAGQSQPRIRGGAEKYSKFAYSTRYAFSVDTGLRRFDEGCFDSMIAFDDGSGWRVREANRTRIADDALISVWYPWPDIEVETRLWWDGPWQMRQHRLVTPRSLSCIEGGFAVCRPRLPVQSGEAGPGRAKIETSTDVSGILDRNGTRTGRVHRPAPNTNLLHARTLVPQLIGTLEPGSTTLTCAVLASLDLAAASAAWRQLVGP